MGRGGGGDGIWGSHPKFFELKGGHTGICTGLRGKLKGKLGAMSCKFFQR